MKSFKLGKQMAAVYCFKCGDVALTDEQYDYQMMLPDAKWICPECGEIADWNDDNYDLYCNDNYPEEE